MIANEQHFYSRLITVRLMDRSYIFNELTKANGYTLDPRDPKVIAVVVDVERRLRNWIGHEALNFVEQKAQEVVL